ncbi:sigma-70 family RNA polymerase sigma factor [Cesiribacter andamanensis]|uniref:RNA polymerase sigma factor, sigma-70 family n=1 Tax=Cesiribacter andamanensis AMV16 TaxID=1279009 RepID=M7N754_9BACT|nr:sigma-70 family RNA polymerase sigma factor [Cesiribacter andamanensis]EMR04443.1 RNA polymerase sigma factor, sigma-70 family [Cesiribacter andamanensis AMV16]
MKKRAAKQQYWTDEQEQAVQAYQVATPLERNRIFATYLYKPLQQLITSVLRRYVNQYADDEELQFELLIHSLKVLDKFRPGQAKAYSYLGTAAKHKAYNYVESLQRRENREQEYASMQEWEYELELQDEQQEKHAALLLEKLQQYMQLQGLSEREKQDLERFYTVGERDSNYIRYKHKLQEFCLQLVKLGLLDKEAEVQQLYSVKQASARRMQILQAMEELEAQGQEVTEKALAQHLGLHINIIRTPLSKIRNPKAAPSPTPRTSNIMLIEQAVQQLEKEGQKVTWRTIAEITGLTRGAIYPTLSRMRKQFLIK